MKTLLWIGAAVIVGLGIWWLTNGKSSLVSNSPSPSVSTSVSETDTTGIGPSGTATPSSTYSQLVALYGTNRMQFGQYCQSIPAAPVYKNGTKVMFDNRSGNARNITINGVTYYFPSYGYRVITLSSITLPKTTTINCGGAVNSGTILIEK